MPARTRNAAHALPRHCPSTRLHCRSRRHLRLAKPEELRYPRPSGICARAADTLPYPPGRCCSTRQRSIPPMQMYLTSMYSSMPYLEPSRPIPDCLTPPKGATSVVIKPVFTPTIPYSSASATRQIRPMSRSEEHTSELQSRVELVCSLLL